MKEKANKISSVEARTGAPADKGTATHRRFDTGAIRDADDHKLDFEGFLSPLTIEAYAEYMHRHRKMPDGSLREADNWQKGLPLSSYMKSLWRHFFAVWKGYRNGGIDINDACGVMFNIMGMMHEILKSKTPGKELH